MKRTIMSLALAFAGTAFAQGAMTNGEVRKIDAATGRITLKHDEIKPLDMPPMTMVFRVKDPGLLGKLQVGDRVKFAAEKIDGQYVVTAIAKAP
jgi:Cu(I)/Ag(I) efflux system protein CusF